MSRHRGRVYIVVGVSRSRKRRKLPGEKMTEETYVENLLAYFAIVAALVLITAEVIG